MNQSLSYEFEAVVPTVLATGIADSLCSIQLPSGILTGAGQPDGTFVAIDGLTDLVVMAAPQSDARIQSAEVKELDNIQVFSPLHVWLAGYYPQIGGYVIQGARAVINGVVYDLLGSETDSQFQTTRISVRSNGM